MGVFAFGGVEGGNPGRPDRAPSPGGAGCRRTGSGRKSSVAGGPRPQTFE